MHEFFFHLFSGLTLGCALLVVANRNAVASAMFLVASFIGMACLFVLLEAYLLAVLQVLVYAGAVVVLFLFIMMLLDVTGAGRINFKTVSVLAGLAAAALLVSGVVHATRLGALPAAEPATGPAVGANLAGFGAALFTTYLLPMQVTGFLLLVAMIGVIVLSKRLDPGPAGGSAPDRPA